MSERARSRGLFRRIYLVFVLTLATSIGVVGISGWLLARASSVDWVADTIETLGDAHDDLVGSLDDPRALGERLRALPMPAAVYSPDGSKIAGDGPARLPARAHRRAVRDLARGRPDVRRHGPLQSPMVTFPLIDARSGELVAVVHSVRGDALRTWLLAGSTLGLLLALAIGAWSLARSLSRRLGALERSAGRLAHGDLAHRVAAGRPARDEIDELGLAFNDMADRIEALLGGQRVLLANVSHELRTPISRVKVLLEILQDRLEVLGGSTEERGRPHLERVRAGVVEMQADIAEIESLIADLLTSGRLELRADAGEAAERVPVALAPLVDRVAARFGATVAVPDGELTVPGDELLLERLLSNLLANARRACPDGAVRVEARRAGDAVVVAVEDEGPGIAPSQRERVFEPFTRLDEARARDRGGSGLGLYLCRQICRAHGGTIAAEGRADGRRGARLVVRLPVADDATDAGRAS